MSTENYSFINPTRIIETAMDSSNLSPLSLSAKSIILKQAERSFPADEAIIRVQEGTVSIPRFEEGTKGRPFKGGPAIVGEKGPEIVTTPDGKKITTPGEATLVNLPPGSQVTPNPGGAQSKYKAIGSRLDLPGLSRIDIRIVDIETGQIIIAKGADGTDANKVYDATVELIKASPEYAKATGVTIPALNQLEYSGPKKSQADEKRDQPAENTGQIKIPTGKIVGTIKEKEGSNDAQGNPTILTNILFTELSDKGEVLREVGAETELGVDKTYKIALDSWSLLYPGRKTDDFPTIKNLQGIDKLGSLSKQIYAKPEPGKPSTVASAASQNRKLETPKPSADNTGSSAEKPEEKQGFFSKLFGEKKKTNEEPVKQSTEATVFSQDKKPEVAKPSTAATVVSQDKKPEVAKPSTVANAVSTADKPQSPAKNEPVFRSGGPAKVAEATNSATSKDKSEKPEEKQGFFSKLFGGKKKEESVQPEVKAAEPKVPKYRVIGEISPSVDGKGNAVPNQVIVDVELEKQSGSDWKYLNGARSDGDIETAYRQAVAIFKNGVLKDYPEAADVKIPSPTELVGYDKIEKPNNSEKSDKPVVSRVYGEIYEVTGVSPDKVGKLDFSPRYEVGLWGEYFDGRKLSEVDTIYGKESKDPVEAYSSAETNFLKAVKLAQKPSAKIPAITELDGYSDIVSLLNKPAEVVKAQAAEPTTKPNQKTESSAAAKTSAESAIVKSNNPNTKEESVASDIAGKASTAPTQAAKPTDIKENTSKLADKDFDELVQLSSSKDAEGLRKKEQEVSTKLKSGEMPKPSESIATDIASKPATQEKPTVSTPAVTATKAATPAANSTPAVTTVSAPAATATTAATPAANSTPAVTATKAATPAATETKAATPAANSTPAVTATKAAMPAANSTPAATATTAATPAANSTPAVTATKAATPAANSTPAATETKAATPAANSTNQSTPNMGSEIKKSEPTDFFSFYQKNQKEISENVVKTRKDLPKTNDATSGTAGTAGTSGLSGNISEDSVATALAANSEAEADAMLEAFLNTGLSASELEKLESNQKSSREFEKALNERTVVDPRKEDAKAEPKKPETPSQITQAANSQPDQANKSSDLGSVKVSSESIATDFAKTGATQESAKISKESIATDLVGPVQPSTPAKTAASQDSKTSKLADKDFEELVQLSSSKDAEGLRKKEMELAAQLRSGAPPTPSESVAMAFTENPQSQTVSAESVATAFTENPQAQTINAESVAMAFTENPQSQTVSAESVATNLVDSKVPNDQASQSVQTSTKEPAKPAAMAQASPKKEESSQMEFVSKSLGKTVDANDYKIEGDVKDYGNGRVAVNLELVDKTGKRIVGTGSSGRPLEEAYADASASMNARLAERGLDGVKIPAVNELSSSGKKPEAAAGSNLKPGALTTAEAAPKKEPEKKGFFSKIKDLFTGNKKKDAEVVAGQSSRPGESSLNKSAAAKMFGLTLAEQEKVNKGLDLYPEEDDETGEAGSIAGTEKNELNTSSVLESEASQTGEASKNESVPTIASVVNGEPIAPKETESKEVAAVQNSLPLSKAASSKIMEPDRSIETAVSGLGGKIVNSSEVIASTVTGAVREIGANMPNPSQSTTYNNTNTTQNTQQMQPTQMAEVAQPAESDQNKGQAAGMNSDHYLRLLYEAIVVHGVKLKTI